MTAWHALFRKSAHDTLYVHALSTFFSEQGECFALKHRRCPSAGRAPGCSRPEEVVLQLRQAEEHRRAGNSRGAEERPAQYSRSSAKIALLIARICHGRKRENRHWPRGRACQSGSCEASLAERMLLTPRCWRPSARPSRSDTF